MTVSVGRDIPMRTTGDGTWLEAGAYEVLRPLHNNRYLIIVRELNKERTLTIIREEEII